MSGIRICLQMTGAGEVAGEGGELSGQDGEQGGPPLFSLNLDMGAAGRAGLAVTLAGAAIRVETHWVSVSDILCG